MSDRIRPSDLPYAGSRPSGVGFCKDNNGNLLWDGGDSISAIGGGSGVDNPAIRKLQGVLLKQFSNTDKLTVGGTGATITAVTDVDGNPAVRYQSATSGNATLDIEVPITQLTGTNPDGTDFDGFGLMFYVPNAATLTSLNIFVGSDPAYGAGSFRNRIVPLIDGKFNNTSPPAGGWNWIYLRKSELTSGTLDLTDVTKPMVVVRISFTAANVGYVDLSSLWFNLPKPKNQLVCTFDDASETVYTVAYPYMRERGMVGTIYMCGSLVNTPGYLTTNQLNELYAAGWDICNHTYSHLFAVTGNGGSGYLTAAQVRTWMADVMRNDQWLANNGWHRGRKHFAYPGGDCSPGIHDVALAFNGFKTGRVINSTGLNAHHIIGCPNPMTIPARGVSSTAPTTDLTNMLENANGTGSTLAAMGRSSFWYIHELSNNVGGNYFPPDRFYTAINRAVELGFESKTISQWAEYAGIV